MKSQVFLAGASVLVLGGLTIPAQAGSLDLGVAGKYAVVSLGDNAAGNPTFQIGQNSGPVTGDELLGRNINAAFSGGGNGAITGTLYYDNTVTGTNTFAQLDTPPTALLVNKSVSDAVYQAAVDVSTYASTLAPTQPFSNLITGNGGLNVINVASISNAAFTITGTAADTFVFNVTTSFNTNQPMTLNGVNASQILFNLTGTGTVFQTSGGNKLFGTFLSVNGGRYQFSNLDLTGEIINSGGDFQLVSGSKVTYTQFTPVPLPSAASAGLALLGAVGGAGWVKRRKQSDSEE